MTTTPRIVYPGATNAFRAGRGFGSRHNRGFSLIEMVIAIVILGIIAGIAATLLAAGIKGYVAGEQAIAAGPKARIAMERMVRELRPACSATFASNQLDYTILNSDGTTTNRAIRRNGSLLQLQVGGSWYTLADSATAFSADTATMPLVQELSITVSGLTLQSTVYLRNEPC